MRIPKGKYTAIIFDLGGVILNLDYHKTLQAFEKLGVANAAQQYSQAQQTPLFDLLETGQISPEEFRIEFKKIVGINCSDGVLDEAWNAMLLDLPRERYDLIASIGQQLPIYLFSNTNHIHITWFNTYLEKQGMSGFFDLFQQAYLSHNVHKRKPDVATFEWVIQQHNLVPETTLFIDDSAQHIEGAQKAGLQTHWLAPHEQIVDLFTDFLA